MKNKFQLIDAHGRHIHKLRVQLTDACNFRCFYCMPLSVKFLPSGDLLTAKELVDICSTLVDFGIDELRVSGGEPTLRKDFEEIICGLSSLPLAKLGLTTNGFFLDEKLDFLKNTKCQHINISLDSLKKEKFYTIIRTWHFDRVYQAVLKAKENGFHVKVNMVVMRNINEDEIFDFLEFSSRYNIEVRFLEAMKIGLLCHNHSRYFVSAREIIEKIEEKERLIPQSVNRDSTSFNFTTSAGAKIGFIASESQPFCCFCSRWRLTATGQLRACLMSEDSVDLRGRKKSEYPDLLRFALTLKPLKRLDHTEQPMYQIGG